MRAIILLLIILIGESVVYGQHEVEVFQFEKLDSVNMKKVKVNYYNNEGKLIEEVQNGFRSNSYSGSVNGTYSYFYNRGLLKSRIFHDKEENTKYKVEYNYNKNGLLVSEKRSTFEKRIKKNVSVGYGAKTCLLTEKHYKKNRTWETSDFINYKYDSLNRKIETYAPKISFGSQNKYTWKYDSLDRVIKKKSFDHDRIIWEKNYEYTTGQIKVSTIWYESDGTPSHLLKDKWAYHPVYTVTKTLNSSNQVIEEFVVTEKNEFRGSKRFKYNLSGDLVVRRFYDSDNSLVLTHKFLMVR